MPTVTFTRLYGFIDILNHMGGKADAAEISSKEQLILCQYLKLVKGWILLRLNPGMYQLQIMDIRFCQQQAQATKNTSNTQEPYLYAWLNCKRN